ncbi:MAG: hypothetical protein JW891_09765 [Candidatus Lokiarchaeota archaeon]|nr:hypothetical protein [Candidatus Lokiarchaeota archaeon]
MKSDDFDPVIQAAFNRKIHKIKTANWKEWLEIESKEEYEQLAFQLSGINNQKHFFKNIFNIKTTSRDFSIDRQQYIKNISQEGLQIFCHTSGTTDSSIANLKWFHMNEDLIKNMWIPGMRAIFESSGLNEQTSAIIFVPSRTSMDGIKIQDDSEYISLYSSEFSQRVVISAVKPKDYILREYKDAFDIEIITKILSIEDPSVISAPAAIILGWADLDRFKKGLSKVSNDSIDVNKNQERESHIFRLLRSEGLNKGARTIQEQLSNKLSDCRLIFSTSGLTEFQWNSISRFMNWDRGKENFTNLYVASEIGPFACSLTSEIARENGMHVFPLTVPMIESNGKRFFISEGNGMHGNLLVSYVNLKQPRFNIDMGDIIFIKPNSNGLPIIEGTIVRNEFKLRYPIKISPKIKTNSNFELSVGHYFSFPGFEINNPKNLLECLKKIAHLEGDSMLITRGRDDNFKPELFFSTRDVIMEFNNDNKKKLSGCLEEKALAELIEKNEILLRPIDDVPVDFLVPRPKILVQVRDGLLPKGILKKWPLYVLQNNN